MLQIVLSLMVGIFIGWNFHLFYSELDKITQSPPKLTLSKQCKEEHNYSKKDAQTPQLLDLAPPLKDTALKASTDPIEENLTESFEELLKRGEFADAMAFYMEGNEEQIKAYQQLLSDYFKEQINLDPQQAIEKILYYIEIEPQSQKMQHYLANYFQKKGKLNNAVTLFERLQEEGDDENITLSLAQLYLDLEKYERSTQLLQEIPFDSIYYDRATHLIEKIQKKQAQQEKYPYHIPLIKEGAHYTLMVEINQTPLKLLLDTGASYTFIDEEKLPSLSIEKEILLNTAGGEIIARVTHVQEFVIDQVKLENFKITMGDFSRNYADGLLGMDFLKQFDFKIDQEKEILYLAQK